MEELGKLERENLRKTWKKEDKNFTPWLADNLDLLAQTIGVRELGEPELEKNVGPFSADIICKNLDSMDDNAWVVIENQIEKTDHSHLGQILTYAAGLKALTLIWIAREFTEEHRAAIDWLNEITGEDFSFFGLEIELWSINGSIPAPKFNVIAKPNISSKQAKQNTHLNETEQLYYSYWESLIKLLKESKVKFPLQSPHPRHWQSFAIGKGGISISATALVTKDRLGVELYIGNSKEYFYSLEEDKENIEKEFGYELDWQALPDKKASRIIIYKENTDIANKADWQEQHKWLKENIEKFHSVFGERVKNL